MYILGALDEETNKYVTPLTAEKGRSYKCIDCQQKVIFRKGTVNKAHFAHYSPTNTCTYYEHPNESQLHKDAKLKMAEYLKSKEKIEFSWSCRQCSSWPGGEEDISYQDGDEVVIEYRDPLGKYIADIALINHGKVRYIFEVKHTHTTTTTVRPEPWFEFTTEDILSPESYFNNQLSLTCIRQTKNRYCDNCMGKTEDWALNLPLLIKRVGQEGMWKQEKPCIQCGTENYSPEFVKGVRQICKMCFGMDRKQLKKKYEVTECLIMDD
jgi:Competence protein CoiA-like family